MRRVTFAALILILPAIATIILYFILKPGRQPTSRDAIGLVRTFAGSGAPGFEDGPAASARFSDPFGIAIDKKGNILVADGGDSNRIRVITPAGRVETIAGQSEGSEDGRLGSASFNTPSGLAIDKRGNVIIADTSNNRIRRLDSEGNVTTVAGSGEAGFKDGPGGEAQFDGPIGIVNENLLPGHTEHPGNTGAIFRIRNRSQPVIDERKIQSLQRAVGRGHFARERSFR